MRKTRTTTPKRAPARRTQAERTALSHERLQQAAIEVIGQRGFRNSSLADIGLRAGYSRALVTLRFGSKEGLLREVASQLFRQWGAGVLAPAVESLRGADAFVMMLQLHRQALEQTPDRLRVLYALMLESQHDFPSLRAEFADLDAGWRAWIVSVVNGMPRAARPRDAMAFATLLLGALRGLVLQWMTAPEQIELQRSYAELARWVTHLLGEPEARGKTRSAPKRGAPKRT